MIPGEMQWKMLQFEVYRQHLGQINVKVGLGPCPLSLSSPLATCLWPGQIFLGPDPWQRLLTSLLWSLYWDRTCQLSMETVSSLCLFFLGWTHNVVWNGFVCNSPSGTVTAAVVSRPRNLWQAHTFLAGITLSMSGSWRTIFATNALLSWFTLRQGEVMCVRVCAIWRCPRNGYAQG